MQLRIPVIKKNWTEWDVVLIFYILCIFSMSIERLSNYIMVLTLFFLGIHVLRNVSIFTNKVSLVWVWYLLVYPIGDYLSRNQQGVTSYILFGYIVPLVYLLFQDRNLEKYKATEYFMLLLAGFEASGYILKSVWYNLYVKIAYRVVGRWSYAVGSFTVDNTVAAFIISIGIIIAFSWWLGYEKKECFRKGKWSFVIVVLFVGLVFSNKRTIFLATLFCCGLIFLFKRVDNLYKAFKYLSLGMLIVIIFVVVSILFYYSEGATNTIGRLGETFVGLSNGEDVTSYRSTLAVYMNLWWKETPSSFVVGIGWGNFHNRIIEYVNVPNGHCVYRQLLCEEGILGLGIFLICSIITLISSIKNILMFRRKNETIEYEMTAISLAGEVLFLIYCYTGNAIYDSYCYLYFFVFVGWTALLSSKRKKMIREQK